MIADPPMIHGLAETTQQAYHEARKAGKDTLTAVMMAHFGEVYPPRSIGGNAAAEWVARLDAAHK